MLNRSSDPRALRDSSCIYMHYLSSLRDLTLHSAVRGREEGCGIADNQVYTTYISARISLAIYLGIYGQEI